MMTRAKLDVSITAGVCRADPPQALGAYWSCSIRRAAARTSLIVSPRASMGSALTSANFPEARQMRNTMRDAATSDFCVRPER
jgi:hypothetical protein